MNSRTLHAAPEALSVGSSIAEFRILRVLGSGGFGIVYLAHDESLGRQVAVKEYLPAIWAGRGLGGRVTLRNSAFADVFSVGLSSFVNEARLLAMFDHPSLVKVHRFWEAHGTAYMVMPYYEGASLRQVRESLSVPLDEAWLRHLLDGLLGALEVMHDASVFHRDVAPDNILVLPTGVPVLLDFGAARYVSGGQTRVLTAILKPSYAPIEQYAGDAEVRQGPWTDIYATAATLHYCLTGKAPPTAAARAVHDTQRPLHQREDFGAMAAGPPYDRMWLEALDWGLAVMPRERPQTIEQWREALAVRSPISVARTAAGTETGPRIAASVHTASEGHFAATELHARMREPATAGSSVARFRATFFDANVARDTPARQGVRAAPAVTPGWRASAWPWVVPRLAAVALAGGLWSLPASGPTLTPTHSPPMVLAPAAAGWSRMANPVLPPAQPGFAPQVFAPADTSAPITVKKHQAKLAGPKVGGSPTAKDGKPPALSLPRQICDQPAWLSRLNCMRIQCATPTWERHPHCANWKVFALRGSS